MNIIKICQNNAPIIFTMCANMPAPSRIIFIDKPRSISRHMKIGTIESENDLSN